MRNTLVILVVCAGLQFWIGCEDDKSTNSANNVERYNVSGTVLTLFASTGNPLAEGLTMVFVDSRLDSQTVVTDNYGHYEVEGLAAGPVAVHMLESDTMLIDSRTFRFLPMYRPRDTTISLTGHAQIDFRIRRLEIAFADGGYNPEKWAWEYGVRNEDGKYIFWYDLRGSDMRMRDKVQVPPGSLELGIIILGEAAPSYASFMDVTWYMNDAPMPYPVLSGLFTTTERYWIEDVPPTHPFWPSGDTLDFRLSMEFRRQTAQYIYVKNIFVYYY